MQNPLSRYFHILQRWIWVIILGIVICGGVAYVVSKKIPPVYQASASLILNECTPQTTPYDCTTAGLEALPTYAGLVTSPTVLNRVVAQHQGLTLSQLSAMITVKPQSNTLLLEVDVTNRDPQLATDLANEISQSFVQFSTAQLPGSVRVIPAQLPTTPSGLKPLTAGLFGALVGIGLSLALIIIFEWIDDRPRSLEEVKRNLGTEVLAVIPSLSKRSLRRNILNIPELAEESRMVSHWISAGQASPRCKTIMITSALPGEGKSTIAANLAYFLAKTGQSVLLVDANLRTPGLHEHFRLPNYTGLAEVISHESDWIEVGLAGQETDLNTLHVLTSGISTGNPADLLQSHRARQIFEDFKKADFDYVIFDTPPLLPVADAQVLASHAQAVVLVVDASRTPRKELLRARELLGRTRSRVLGAVLNKSLWRDTSDIRDYLEKVHRLQRSSVEVDSSLQQGQFSVNEPAKTLPKVPLVHVNAENGNKVGEHAVPIQAYLEQQDKDKDE